MIGLATDSLFTCHPSFSHIGEEQSYRVGEAFGRPARWVRMIVKTLRMRLILAAVPLITLAPAGFAFAQDAATLPADAPSKRSIVLFSCCTLRTLV